MSLLTLLADTTERLHADTAPAWWLIGIFAIQGFVIWLFARRRYLVWNDGELKPAFTELQQFSAYLLSGAIIAQIWAHGDWSSYAATIHAIAVSVPAAGLEFDLHFVANEVIMTFFFGIAAKELAEATLKPNGTLRGTRSVLPLMACAGGVVVPALFFLLLCTQEMTKAWAVPCATDIAFAWLGARVIWGPTHPAIPFLLALAIADDFVGMAIIAVFYPLRPFAWSGLAYIAFGVLLALLCNRAASRYTVLKSWQIFVIPGIACWIGLFVAGLHSALALVFVVPFIPMVGEDQGLFAEEDSGYVADAMNRFEHAHKPFVDTGLFFFGLANAGVVWWGAAAWDQNSWAVFLSLGLGKMIGITVFTLMGFQLMRVLRAHVELPRNVKTSERLLWRDVPLLGLLGGMGFTVALFVAEAAGGHASLKLGALASFAFLAIAVVIGRIAVRPKQPAVLRANAEWDSR